MTDYEMTYEEVLQAQIAQWWEQTTLKDFYRAIQRRVIGQPNLIHICANIYHFLCCIMAGIKAQDNILIAAPSGSGKTETYRAISEYFSENIPMLPVILFDMTQLSPSGFRGANKDDALVELFRLSHSANTDHPAALLFLDEIDKKIMPAYDASGRNVNADVQADLLTMLEGSSVSGKNGSIYTDRILFFGLGSFDAFRTRREEKKSPIGFCQGDAIAKDHFDPVVRENMIRLGASHELLGRFPFIVNYGKLSKESLLVIIQKSLLELSGSYNCNIEISQEFKNDLLQDIDSPYGCRTLANRLKQSALIGYEKAQLSADSFETMPKFTLLLISDTEAELVPDENPEDEINENY